jgi:hypothetical protein
MLLNGLGWLYRFIVILVFKQKVLLLDFLYMLIDNSRPRGIGFFLNVGSRGIKKFTVQLRIIYLLNFLAM